jgi:hypothetical protein
LVVHWFIAPLFFLQPPAVSILSFSTIYQFKTNHFVSAGQFADDLDETELRVSVPSYLLRGAGSNTHFEYEVRVSVSGARWTLLRRYKRFRELHLDMRARYGIQVDALPFPPRKFFAKNSENVAKQRRRQLEVCFYCVKMVVSDVNGLLKFT